MQRKRIAGCFLAAVILAMAVSGCGSREASVQDGATEKIQSEENEQEAENGQGIGQGQTAGNGQSAGQGQAAAAEQNTVNGQAAEDEQTAENEQAARNLEELKAAWRSAGRDLSLEEIQSDLDQAGLCYEGYYNVSGERLDVKLSDDTALIFMYANDPMAGEAGRFWSYADRDPAQYVLVMLDGEFNNNAFQEDYLNQYDVTVEEYYYPNASEPLEENGLWGLQTDLSIARNQIYAVHGRIFQDPFLDAVFRQKSWYEPKYSASEFDEGSLTEVERENLKILTELEERMHYRKSGSDSYESPKALLSGSWLDLDSDGEPEQILYNRIMQNSSNQYGGMGQAILEIREKGNGTSGRVEAEDSGPHPVCYVASFQGRTRLIVAWNGASADYVLDFYEYGAEGLQYLGKIDTDAMDLQIKEEKMLARVETCHLQCQPLELAYTIENGQIKWLEQEYYEYPGNSAEVMQSLSLYTKKGGSDEFIALQKGDEVRVLGGDLDSWVQLEKVSTGEKGWLKVTGIECTLPDGRTEASSQLFDGLYFYG